MGSGQDRARGSSFLIKALGIKGKKTAPVYVDRLGLSVPYISMHCYMIVINHVNMLGLRAPYNCMNVMRWYYAMGTCDKRPKSARINTCAQGAAQPLVAEDSLIFIELGLSGSESVG